MIFGMKNRPQPTLFNKKKIYNQKVSFNMILKDTFLLYLLIFYDKGLARYHFPSVSISLTARRNNEGTFNRPSPPFE
jgi:hypothetical protein